MARVKARDLRGLSKVELEQKKSGLEKELLGLRQKKALGTLEKPHQFKIIRRQIAQINTVEKEK